MLFRVRNETKDHDVGVVRCWGRASTGALGYGNTNDIGDDEVPWSAGGVRFFPP